MFSVYEESIKIGEGIPFITTSGNSNLSTEFCSLADGCEFGPPAPLAIITSQAADMITFDDGVEEMVIMVGVDPTASRDDRILNSW